MIDIVRRTARRRFDPDEFAVLARAAPIMGRGFGAALRREASLRNDVPAHPKRSGIVILDGNTRVTMATPAGEEWLSQLWDYQEDGHARLPTAVWAAVAAFRANASFAPAVTTRTNAGAVRIEASSGAEEGTVALVLSPVLPA
jgi:hypothetical protein